MAISRRYEEKIASSVTHFFILVIRGYQYLVSPLLGQNCRFYPSCSYYAIKAFSTHGLMRGALFFAKRILRCHPWHEGGIDPVPPIALKNDSAFESYRPGSSKKRET